MKQNYVYKITNLINLKIYIGVHFGEPDDSYMGSGKAIKAAIKKYGIENFKKEIVDVLDSIEEAYKLESEIVNAEFVARPDTYNCGPGGSGPTIETRRKMSEAQTGKKASEETRRKMSEAKKGRKLSDETRRKISEAGKGKKHSGESRRKLSESHHGMKASEETRRKISEARKGMKFSDEHRRKISENHVGTTGMKFSEETRRKMSEAQKLRRSKLAVSV